MDSPLDLLGAVLAFWYSLVASYGVAIIGLTVVVRLLLFPLTAKSVRSQRAMAELQPQIKQIQARHRDDRQKMNEELMRFYKDNRINPLSGCLPLLLQMPVFFGLLRVLNDPFKYVPRGSELFSSMCPDGYDVCSDDGVAHLRFLGMDLQTSPVDASGGFMDTLPYWLLLGLVVLTGLYQGRQMLARQTNPNPQVAIIARVMPVLFGVFSVSFASGVIVYFLTSNMWQIGQQAIIYRSKFVPGGEPAADAQSDDEGTAAKAPAAAGRGMRSLFAGRLPGGGSTVDLAKREPEPELPAADEPPAPEAKSGSRTRPGQRSTSGSGGTSGPRPEAERGASKTPATRSSGGQRPSGRAAGTSNRSKNKRKRR